MLLNLISNLATEKMQMKFLAYLSIDIVIMAVGVAKNTHLYIFYINRNKLICWCIKTDLYAWLLLSNISNIGSCKAVEIRGLFYKPVSIISW